MKKQTKKKFSEKRDITRTKTVIKATANHAGSSVGERCIIRDASKEGAKIYCANLDLLPNLIILEIEGYSTPVQAEIVWRKEKFAGVKIDWATTQFIHSDMATLLLGLKGESVRLLQKKLGVDADGIFGGDTEQALKDYQKAKGLAADGIAGPDTFSAMGLHQLVILKHGTRGDTVKKMQQALEIDADGKFGPGTEKAVKAYQESKSLTADGVAGSLTLAKLNLGDEVASSGDTAPATAGTAENGRIRNSVEEETTGAFDKVKSILGL